MSYSLPPIARILLPVLGLVLDCRAIRAEDDAWQLFRAEAPSAWSKMAQLARHIDLELVRTTTTQRGRLDSVWAVKWNGDHVAAISKDEFTPIAKGIEPTYRELAFCANSKNAFRVAKAAPDQSWFIERFSKNPQEMNRYMMEELRTATIPLFALMVFGEFLPDWHREETFSVKQVHWDDQRSGRRAALEFAYRWPAGKTHTHAYWPRSGTLFLRPDLSWAVEEFQVEMVDESDPAKKQFHWSQQNELKGLADDFPGVVRAQQLADSVGEGRSETTWTFRRFELAEVPEREFTLAAFGLPELGDTAKPVQVKLWMILLTAGIASIAIAIWFRRRTQPA